MSMLRPHHSGVLLLVAVVAAVPARGQQVDSVRHRSVVSGAISVTNKGISVIPTFTLGKPATVIDLVVAKRRVSFEPQFRAGLDGKPWSFIFWGRYQLVQRPRFHVQVGAHPAVLFRKTSTTISGTTGEYLVARRYLAAEIAPTVTLSPHVNAGVYYLTSRALENDVARYTNYVAARAGVSGIPLLGAFVMRLDPQVYFLRTGGQQGSYANGGVTIAKRRSPFSISATANKPLSTNVTGGTEFLWNVSVNVVLR